MRVGAHVRGHALDVRGEIRAVVQIEAAQEILDRDGLYDLQTDPIERHNLIDVPAFCEQGEKLRQQLFEELQKSGGLQFSIVPPAGEVLDDRKLWR